MHNAAAIGAGIGPRPDEMSGKEALTMSSMRHDPSQRPGPIGRSMAQATASPPSQADDRGPGDAVLTIIVPAKNESASLPELLSEIARAFRPLRDRGDAGPHRLDDFEVIIIDDGSTDDTRGVLRRSMAAYPELRPIVMATNVGQSAAIAAGFHAARGAWVAILDADLQNNPADLAMLWDALPGHDAALGWRTKREDVWSKRVISTWANRARNMFLGQSIRDTGCAVRIFPRAAALRFPMFQGAHRFFGPLLIREGCRIVQLPVVHRPRPHGNSHYNIWNRSVRVVVDLFGVAWLMRRAIPQHVAPDALAGPADGPHPSPSHAGVGRQAAGRGA